MKSDETFPPTVVAERTLDRRRFLRAGAAATALVACGEWAARRTAPAVAGRVTLGVADPLEIGEARALSTTADVDVLAVRLDADTVVAFDRRCPHLGCPVVWAAERERFECPCHRAAFDARTGRVLFGPPQRGLAPVDVA